MMCQHARWVVRTFTQVAVPGATPPPNPSPTVQVCAVALERRRVCVHMYEGWYVHLHRCQYLDQLLHVTLTVTLTFDSGGAACASPCTRGGTHSCIGGRAWGSAYT